MGDPPPPPLLLLLLSLAGPGAAAESIFQQDLLPEEYYRCPSRPWPVPQQGCRTLAETYQAEVLRKLFCHLDTDRRRRELLASNGQGTEHLLPPPRGSSDRILAVAHRGLERAAVRLSASPKLQAKGSSRMPAVLLSLHPRLSTKPLATAAQAVGGAARKRECPCSDGDHHQAPGQQPEAARMQEAGAHARTPRTEEAAWAASALTFLLVTLTLAVLYTRLHRNCRRGQSLYWTMSGEDGRETVATVIKRRMLSVQSRRKKRPRQQRVLLQTTSSESTE